MSVNPFEILGAILLVGLLVVTLIATLEAEEQLENPDNKSIVYLHQLQDIAEIKGYGIWLVRVYRQSGNIHSENKIVGEASLALRAAITTFKRAKIDSVGIRDNLEHYLHFGRLFHSHRGSNEGKKVGSVEVIWLSAVEDV
jgi:hypothetical protein